MRLVVIFCSVACFILASCSVRDPQSDTGWDGLFSNTLVDGLNDAAYAWHYRDIDSTEAYARRAMAASAGSGLANFLKRDGCAEALNHLAFVSLVRMDYELADRQLDSILLITDNQLELLVAYVQKMRLCQRRSSNREFYDFREKALHCLQRLDEDRGSLSERQKGRLCYAETEMAIVTSTYYYYVGLERQSAETMLEVSSLVTRDTAQLMNYLYNVGAGGIINTGTQVEINQSEFDHLMRCFLLSRRMGSSFFTANALEALAEHLIDADNREQLISDNLPAMKYLNPDGIEDDLLPLWLAEEALDIFSAYGDTYQIAGAYRTLASCYLARDDYERALFCLDMALSDSAINQAPDLVASIREQLSVAYAAIDDKAESNFNRNIYLDLQEETRQDRQQEARAGQLEQALRETERLLWAVVFAVVVLMAIIALYHHLRRHHAHRPDEQLQEREEELREQTAMMRLNVERGERRHLEQRAKVSLIMGIIPLIDRILHTINHAQPGSKQEEGSNGYMNYVSELTAEIDRQNELLTHWIQLRQGELSLRIETFALQELFDMVRRSERTFAMKGVTLSVEPTTASVKADRVLTLFMLNTLADNARKFTNDGGTVSISAVETDDYVELSVADTGCGMDDVQLSRLFTPHVPEDLQTSSAVTSEKGHGFGLLNCKGIIEKYRKTSSVFSVCQLSAESRVGEGSRFSFRLPKGTVNPVKRDRSLQREGKADSFKRGLLGLLCFICLMDAHSATVPDTYSSLAKAAIYADSTFFSNINGDYERSLLFADSCRHCLNEHYLQQHPLGKDTLQTMGSLSTIPAEIHWLHDSIDSNFNTILDMRNESAVAALALHRWSLYQYNNRIYTQLFKELSADTTLDDYCRKMQQTHTNRQVAIIMLVLLFIVSLVAVAWQLMQSMRLSASRQQEQQDRLDMMGDELQRLTMENNALHVSNAVLDNTLSTLKHETMYYPSRIQQLVGTESGSAADSGLCTANSELIKEVVSYYRELYGVLSQQAMRQAEIMRLHLKPLENGILGDENLIRYLFEILRKKNGQQKPETTFVAHGERYVECRVSMPTLQRTDLFTPSSEQNIPWLLCRQIVRDHGEATNRRACAIRAEKNEQGVTIVITLPKHNKS